MILTLPISTICHYITPAALFQQVYVTGVCLQFPHTSGFIISFLASRGGGNFHITLPLSSCLWLRFGKYLFSYTFFLDN